MTRHHFLRAILAGVWLVMGLGCKVLGLTPRHEAIVARILGEDFAPLLTRLIGVSEIGMAVWILSGMWPRLCAWLQILLVLTMNLIEITMARDLLLFGPLNLVFAIGFAGFVYFVEQTRPDRCSTV